MTNFISVKQYKAMSAKPRKYRNIKVGGKDSKKEYARGLFLKQLEKEGKISHLEEQVSFLLQDKILDEKGKVAERAIKFIADYVYTEDAEVIVEDVKSWITKRNPTYILKRKMFRKLFPQYKFKEV
jgi:hypothetical protein